MIGQSPTIVSVLEDDPYFLSSGPYASGQKGYIRGLDSNKTYNLNWVYNTNYGIKVQGQGNSDDGEYVTKDWDKTNSINDGSTYFKYGKGGQWGTPRAWATVATGSTRLRPHDWIKISILPNRGPFEVLDTGEAVGESHIDVFIGDELLQTAFNLGVDVSKVSVLLCLKKL